MADLHIERVAATPAPAPFMKRRALATKALTVAAQRFGVSLDEALHQRDHECIKARWAAWAALSKAGWKNDDIADMFGVHRTAVPYAMKHRGPDLDEHVDAVMQAIGVSHAI